MATSRSNLPKEMLPFGKGAKKGTPAKGNPFGGGKAPPFGKDPKAKPKKGNPFAFADGGSVKTTGGSGAAPAALPPTPGRFKATGGGTARGTGAATKGKKFEGTY